MKSFHFLKLTGKNELSEIQNPLKIPKIWRENNFKHLLCPKQINLEEEQFFWRTRDKFSD